MLRYAPIVHASATSGEGVDEAFDLALAAGKWRRERIPRIRLEELYQRATLLKPLPLVKNTGGKNRGALKIRSVAQSDTETPTFVFHLNRDAELHPSRMKWLENVIRQHYPFTATPLRLVLRGPKLREARFRKARKMGKVGKIVEARGQRSVK
jgi:GTP-binding protein